MSPPPPQSAVCERGRLWPLACVSTTLKQFTNLCCDGTQHNSMAIKPRPASVFRKKDSCVCVCVCVCLCCLFDGCKLWGLSREYIWNYLFSHSYTHTHTHFYDYPVSPTHGSGLMEQHLVNVCPQLWHLVFNCSNTSWFIPLAAGQFWDIAHVFVVSSRKEEQLICSQFTGSEFVLHPRLLPVKLTVAAL